ncbi:MAG: hypothetical protein M5U34_06730 [Chloroflexi bacterium]|nr:hypothetical protein [Chloroflexota bacterium]
MSILTREDLKKLYQEREGNCVSIYMPTQPQITETDQGRIQLRNLLAEAEKRLLAAGLRVPDAQKLLEPAQKFLWDKLFWRHQDEGLALFLSTETFYSYHLPYDFEAQVVIADRFHIKPLLPLLADDGQFFILALSQNQARLLQGTRHSIQVVDEAEIPASLAETMVADGPEKQLQFHTSSGSPGSGKRAAIFHGHDAAGKLSRTNIRRYFRQIDKGLSAWLANEHAPLLLAGVDSLFPLYKEVNSYPHLVDKGIGGNPEELRAEELGRRGWAIVEPLFHKARQQATSQYQQLMGSANERASNDSSQIIEAAFTAASKPCLWR